MRDVIPQLSWLSSRKLRPASCYLQPHPKHPQDTPIAITLAMRSLALLNIFLLFKNAFCIPLANFYPFGERERDAAVGRNDDGSSELITLTSNFPFFDENFRNIYVCYANTPLYGCNFTGELACNC